MSSSGTGMPQSPTGPIVASSSSLPTLDVPPATPASPPVAVEGVVVLIVRAVPVLL